jgi:hypothetical protein
MVPLRLSACFIFDTAEEIWRSFGTAGPTLKPVQGLLLLLLLLLLLYSIRSNKTSTLYSTQIEPFRFSTKWPMVQYTV